RFFFWPVHSLHEREGWACGYYGARQILPMKTLLERGRIQSSRRHRDMPYPTDLDVERSYRHYENLGMAVETDRALHATRRLDYERFIQPTTEVSDETVHTALMALLDLQQGDVDAALEY